MSDSSYTFDSPGADVVLRAPLRPEDPESTEFKDFHVHKLILSIASTIFNDMFSVPQPTESGANLPVVHVVEPAEPFEIFLRLIYPVDPPTITSLEIVDHLSLLAVKYMTSCVRAKLRQILVTPSSLNNDPVWVYVIACRMELEEEAKVAIAHTYRIDLTQEISDPLLRTMTAETYNRLLRAHATRRGGLISVVNQVEGPSYGGARCTCSAWFYTRLSMTIILGIWEVPILDRPRLDLCLSKVEGGSGCKNGSDCRVSARSTSAYFTNILEKIEKLT